MYSGSARVATPTRTRKICSIKAKDMVAEFWVPPRAAGGPLSRSGFAMGVNNRAIKRHPDWAMVQEQQDRASTAGTDRGCGLAVLELTSPHSRRASLAAPARVPPALPARRPVHGHDHINNKACYCRWCLERMRNEGSLSVTRPQGIPSGNKTMDRVVRIPSLSFARLGRTFPWHSTTSGVSGA